MARKAPGKSHRKGLTFLQVAEMFGTEEAATAWLEEQRWPNGPHCPKCGSLNVQSGIKHKTMTHRCRDCMTGKSKTMFSLKTGTVMEGSKLAYRHWAIAIYLFLTNIKGVSSMRLHRELGIGQKAAWFMLHRLRKAFEVEAGPFSGPVEADETYVGGKRKNMSNAKRTSELKIEGTGRGSVGKAAVVGVSRPRHQRGSRTAQVRLTDMRHVPGSSSRFNAKLGSKVYTDDALVYDILDAWYDHETCQALGIGVCARPSTHERHRVLLVHVEARLQRHVPQDVAEALGPVYPGILRAAQRSGAGHRRADGWLGDRHGREAN